MKKLTQTSILFLLALSLLTFTQCKDAKNAAVTKILEVYAKQINDNCPMQVNQAVRIDSCRVTDKMTIKTHSTISYVNAKNFNPDEFIKMTKPGLLYTIQTNNDLKSLRDLDVIFIYSYNDDSGKPFGEITIGPEDYNQPVDENNKGDLASMKTEDTDALLNKVVTGIKDHLPMEVDEITTLVECNALPNKTLEYTYKLSTSKKDMADNFEEIIKDNLKQTIKTNAQTKMMIDAGITIVYIYKDKSGKEFSRISFDSSDM